MTRVSTAESPPRAGPSDAPLTFEGFCRAVQPRLLGTLALQYGGPVAEDLVQETLARVHAHWPSVRGMDNPRAWAYRVALNLGNSWLRRRRAERRALARAGSAVDEVVTGLDRTDVLAVRDAVARLAKGQRTALFLRYYADLPVKEVAQIMGCSPGTVTSQTRDALAALRAGGLVPDDGGRSGA